MSIDPRSRQKKNLNLNIRFQKKFLQNVTLDKFVLLNFFKPRDGVDRVVNKHQSPLSRAKSKVWTFPIWFKVGEREENERRADKTKSQEWKVFRGLDVEDNDDNDDDDSFGVQTGGVEFDRHVIPKTAAVGGGSWWPFKRKRYKRKKNRKNKNRRTRIEKRYFMFCRLFCIEPGLIGIERLRLPLGLKTFLALFSSYKKGQESPAELPGWPYRFAHSYSYIFPPLFEII